MGCLSQSFGTTSYEKSVIEAGLMSVRGSFPFLKDDSLRYTVKLYQRQVTLCGRKEEQAILMQNERVKASIEASRTGDSWIS